METLIAVSVFLILAGLAIKKRYQIAAWLNLKDIPPEAEGNDVIDDQIIELKRTVEDCERDIERLEKKKLAE